MREVHGHLCANHGIRVRVLSYLLIGDRTRMPSEEPSCGAPSGHVETISFGRESTPFFSLEPQKARSPFLFSPHRWCEN